MKWIEQFYTFILTAFYTEYIIKKEDILHAVPLYYQQYNWKIKFYDGLKYFLLLIKWEG